jgi:hypothetical protein
MTWWSHTECHIETVMTEMNSYGHGMHPVVLTHCGPVFFPLYLS